MYYFYLYSITSPTGKIYIGQTRLLEKRIYTYKTNRCTKQHILLRSLKKYGWENHRLDILEQGEMTQDQINELEIQAIAKIKAAGKSMNICVGGATGPAYKGKNHPNSKALIQFDLKGNILKEWANAREAFENVPEINDAIGISVNLQHGRHYAYGYLWIYKEDYLKGKRPWHDRLRNRNIDSVIQLSLEGEYITEYRSVNEAARKLNLKAGSINLGLSKNGYSCGFLWCRKTAYEKGFRPKLISKKAMKNRPILMLSKDGKILKEFKSMVEAASESGYCRSAIRKQCQGITKSSTDVYFQYKP